MKITLIFTAIMAFATAQSISDLPTCSHACLTTAIDGLGCGLSEFSCSCQKADQLTPAVTSCIQSACSDPSDQYKTIEVLSGICAAAGFPIEPPASSAATEPIHIPSSEAPVETQPHSTEEVEYSEYPTDSSYLTTTELSSTYPASFPTNATANVPNLPSSYSDSVPVPSSTDTLVVSHPSPHPTSLPGMVPPYPTDVPGLSTPAPFGTGAPSTTPSRLPEFTAAAAAAKLNVVAAGVFGLAAFVL